MIAIVVPAHNEEAFIERCVESLVAAGRHPELGGEVVEIVVVLDSCHDRTGFLARNLGAKTVDLRAKNVGLARQSGAELALAQGARWLAFTDADTCVASDWLVAQLSLETDAVCGTVAVSDWLDYGPRMKRHFELTYRDVDGHSHVHGANLGVCAKAYTRAGGFTAGVTGEDHALVKALGSTGARISWSRLPRVVTSARPNYRAPEGFGATLKEIAERCAWAGTNGTMETS